jgi:hypothetical protein
MDISARGFAISLVVSGSLISSANARAQYEQAPFFNPPPPDVTASSTYAGPHPFAARRGPQLGLRVGYASGTGIVYSGLNVHDASDGALPVTVDLGWRFLPQLYAGVYGSFAPVFTKGNPLSCPAGFDCNAQDWRFGVQVDYHFLPRTRLDPYVGLGGGYEILHTNANGPVVVPTPLGNAPGNASAGIIDRGWEFAALTLGFDARINAWSALALTSAGRSANTASTREHSRSPSRARRCKTPPRPM